MKEKSFSEIIESLRKGNAEYMHYKYNNPGLNPERREALTHSQHPDTIILGCADSRVPPELVFGKGPGDLFTVRVAGNIPNPASIASIEYAVDHIDTPKKKVLVILGHESCGAVGAAIKAAEDSEVSFGYYINELLSYIRPALVGGIADKTAVIKRNAEITAKVLQEQSGIIHQAVKENRLLIVPAYYSLQTGGVSFFLNNWETPKEVPVS